MTDKHKKRKGVGCLHECWEECCDKPLCSYAQYNFGGGYYCLAPKDCWIDKKITKPFEDRKHCPNCSRPNKPFKLKQVDKHNAECKKCKYHYGWESSSQDRGLKND